MRSKLIHLLLLMALTLNIAHASIISADDHCHHENVSEYVLELSDSQGCNDLCDLHHLFHMTAIMTNVLSFTDIEPFKVSPQSKLLTYHPPFKETENKPPIA